MMRTGICMLHLIASQVIACRNFNGREWKLLKIWWEWELERALVGMELGICMWNRSEKCIEWRYWEMIAIIVKLSDQLLSKKRARYCTWTIGSSSFALVKPCQLVILQALGSSLCHIHVQLYCHRESELSTGTCCSFMALPSNVILNIPIVASVVAEAPLVAEHNQFDVGSSSSLLPRVSVYCVSQLCSVIR